jgi:tetratricopeptide (TPR) repeat protein
VAACGLASAFALGGSGAAWGGSLSCHSEKLVKQSAKLKPLIEVLAKARSSEDDATLESLAKQLDARAKERLADARDFFWGAVAQEALLEVHLSKGEEKKAKERLGAALAHLDRSLELDEASPDAHALRAILYGYRITFSSAFTRMFVGMKYGSKIDEELKRARELDSSSPAVALSSGRSAFFKPGMFGGGAEQALTDFQRATQLVPSCAEAWLWSGLAFGKLQRWKEARAAFNEALRLDTVNAWAKRELARLGDKGK